MIRRATDIVADTLLAGKDFVVGTVLGPLSNTYSWARWAFPAGLVLGAITAISGGAAAGIMMAMAVPAAAAVVGGVWGLLSGGVKEVSSGLEMRAANRVADRELEAQGHDLHQQNREQAREKSWATRVRASELDARERGR